MRGPRWIFGVDEVYLSMAGRNDVLALRTHIGGCAPRGDPGRYSTDSSGEIMQPTRRQTDSATQKPGPEMPKQCPSP